ncbi:unnamed protein product [Effrenium voratum]|uniref:Uncharacterized protein n=1 Tax=Effrenium voratum TaxID=2562239 RepID=A0AA36NGG3_9DINO|nr:unnamed protein product [Effrenium voratum]
MAQAFGFRRCLRLAKASVSRHGLHASLLGGSIAGAATLCKAETQVDTLTRLGELDTCALCDASGKKARVITTVRPLKPGYRMAGRVRTVAVDGDFLEILAVLREVQPGEVVMIDASMRGGPEDSTWPRSGGLFGELLASEAQRRGVRGMVVDGNCRDTPMLRQMSLPVFCRGHHPNAGFAQKRGTSQVEIRMGGTCWVTTTAWWCVRNRSCKSGWRRPKPSSAKRRRFCRTSSKGATCLSGCPTSRSTWRRRARARSRS